VDCNNYIDVAMNVTSPIRAQFASPIFSNSDTLSARYSLSRARLHAYNLPGFGTSHDDFSQQGSLRGHRIITPSM